MPELSREIRGLVHEICDRNLGAVNVCMMLYVLKRVDVVRRFKELGIHGPAIWVAWQDYSKQDIDQLAKGLHENLPKLNAVFATQGMTQVKADDG